MRKPEICRAVVVTASVARVGTVKSRRPAAAATALNKCTLRLYNNNQTYFVALAHAKLYILQNRT